MAVKKTTKKKTTKKKQTQPIPPPLTAQDKRWQAEDDARVLAQAEEVKNNAPRLKAAKVQAKKMAKEQEATLASLKRIAEK